MKKWNDDTITINGKEIEVKSGFIAVKDLLFYPENPRLYTIVNAKDNRQTQDEIFRNLSRMDHVKQLVQSIDANGGLTDPLIVLRKDYQNIVIEGNSRLAAYKILVKKYGIQKYGMVKCKLIEDEIGENDIFKLLGEYHIIGRKDWAPYEQAGYLYRRNMQQGVSKEIIAKELGMSKKKINHLIKVYTFMIKNNENQPEKWSYYDEYLKKREVNEIRKKKPEIDSVVVKLIKTGDIETARDVRDKLPKILRSGQKNINKFIKCENNFAECYEKALEEGADSYVYQKMNKFRHWTSGNDLSNIIKKSEDEPKDKCIYEMRKIISNLNTIIERLKK